MSGAIISSSTAFLLLVAPSSSSPRRRVSSALRSYGGAGLRLHWARRGSGPDGAVVCAAAAAAGAGGEEDAAKAAAGGSSKVVAVQGEVKAAEAKYSTSSPRAVKSKPKQGSSVAKQNGALGSKSAAPVSKRKVEPSATVSKAETDSNAQIAELKAALDDQKDVGVAEPVETKADAGIDAEAASSAGDSGNKESGPLAGPNVMNVIVVASECSLFCKTGGLGDVVGALPKALARRGHRVMVVIPKYGEYAEACDLGVRRRYRVAGQDSEVTYFHAYIDGVDFVFIETPPFRHRHNDIYGGERPDILKRMILFCKAAVEVPSEIILL